MRGPGNGACVVVAAVLVAGFAVSSLAQGAAPKKEGWESSLSLGGNMTEGNSKTRTANGSLVGAYARGKNECRLGIEGNYGETEVSTTDGTNTVEEMDTNVQNAKVFVTGKHILDERLYGYTDNSLLYDKIADLDYRLIVGVGPGYYLVKSDTSKMGVEAGVAYVVEDYGDNDQNDDFPAFRVAERLDHKLSDTAKLWESAEYLPKADDFGVYLVNAEAGVEAALNVKLSLRLVLQERYNSDPADGKERSDTSLVAALVYKIQ